MNFIIINFFILAAVIGIATIFIGYDTINWIKQENKTNLYNMVSIIKLIVNIIAIILVIWTYFNLKCDNCGKLDAGSEYCTHCGYAKVLKCTECNSPVDENDFFCQSCGASLEKE